MILLRFSSFLISALHSQDLMNFFCEERLIFLDSLVVV